MTLSLATNEQRDIYIGRDGSLATLAGAEAVGAAAQSNASALLGEMLYAADQGVPFFDVALGGSRNLAQFEAYTRRAIAQTPGVVRVESFEVSTEGDVLRYSARILTIYGEALVNG